MMMPATTPEFLEYARERHAWAEEVLRAEDDRLGEWTKAEFVATVLKHQTDPDWHAEAVECYERAQRDFAAQAEEIERLRRERIELREALSWALDCLEITLRRLDTIDEPASERHLAIRAAGMKKARAALSEAAPREDA